MRQEGHNVASCVNLGRCRVIYKGSVGGGFSSIEMNGQVQLFNPEAGFLSSDGAFHSVGHRKRIHDHRGRACVFYAGHEQTNEALIAKAARAGRGNSPFGRLNKNTGWRKLVRG